MAIRFVGWKTWGPFAIPWFISVIKGNKKKPMPEVEVIGVKDPDLLFKTSGIGNLTETIFDTTTRPDEAHILLTNATGTTHILKDCYIRGKIIRKVGGDSGYCNDKHIDYEAIARDGENKFELGNNFICTLTQVNKLADWHWKLNKTKKHIYTVSLKGFQSYFEPGEWYVLTIGSAGTAEYIDSTVECYSVRCAYDAKGSMGTQVSFREVEENWKFDSNAVARYVAAGGHNRNPQGTIVTIGASNFDGYADYYCPGTTDDSTTIQMAVDAASGEVHFTRGDYYPAAQINLPSDIVISGESGGTVFHTSGLSITEHCFAATGTTDLYKSNIIIRGVKFYDDGGSTMSNCINMLRADYVTIENCIFNSKGKIPIYVGPGAHYSILNNDISNGSTTQSVEMLISLAVNNSLVHGNYLHDSYVSGMPWGTEGYGIRVYWDNNAIINNDIQNVIDYSTDSTAYAISGIKVDAVGNNIIRGNRVSGTTSYSGANAYGIWVTAGSTYNMIMGNMCINNGSDTGIANINSNNFLCSGTTSLISNNSWQ